MALRRGHGTAAKRGRPGPRVEVVPPDELPAGVAGERSRGNRDAQGRLVAGAATTELAREAALRRAELRRLEQLLGRVELPPSHPVEPYLRDAAAWRNAQLEVLARTVGGGSVGPGPAALLSTSALELAASRWMFDEALQNKDHKLATNAARLADASRQNLLAAHELCAREAAAHQPKGPIDLGRALSEDR